MTTRRYSLDGVRKVADNLPDDSSQVSADGLKRDVRLEIFLSSNSGFFLTVGGDEFFPNEPSRSWTDTLPITKRELFGHVDVCNRVWTDELVHYKSSPSLSEKPFLNQWDRPVGDEVLHNIGAQLAKAGDRLFFHLFKRHTSPKLRRIVASLENASRKRELTLTVHSDEFFAPWSMIYIHPDPNEELLFDGSNFRWDGFWGYRHRIEHNPDDHDLTPSVRPNEEGRIPTSVNIDDKLDHRLKIPCIGPQLIYFQGHDRLTVTIRRDKKSLEADFRQPPFPYRIVYFCCHGATSREDHVLSLEQPWIKLTDSKDIGPSDISYWLQGRDLESRPLIFINACQSGQMHSMYYESIASEFLKKKAVGLLGAQIDMPAVFAQQYAQMFFARLLGDKPNACARVGELVPALTRTLIHDHGNPLGLGYSLYRGLDCGVDWTPLP